MRTNGFFEDSKSVPDVFRRVSGEFARRRVPPSSLVPPASARVPAHACQRMKRRSMRTNRHVYTHGTLHTHTM
jgi:hypothetical protein